jgi:hypothetical protein
MDNAHGTLYRIAENESDLNNLYIDKSVYKIIEDTQINFNNVKYGLKDVVKYNDQIITYSDTSCSYDKTNLTNHVNLCKDVIKKFLKNNINHPLFNQWNNYYNQLNSLDFNSIAYPFNKSLEQYFKDLGQPSLNILQLP